jgi:hypothetical protein
LIEPLTWRQTILFHLNNSQCDRLLFGGDDHANGKISPSFRPPACFPGNDLNCTCGFLALDVILCPALFVKGGVHQLGMGVSFAEGHGNAFGEHRLDGSLLAF